MDYTELHIIFKAIEPWREIVTTYLSAENFESFTEEKNELKAYIPKAGFSEEKLACLKKFEAYIENYKLKTIEDRNWNAEWEKNFDPVYVGDQLAILAPFHDQNIPHLLKVLIQPQMSFGTGHHQTTWLAAQNLLNMDLRGKEVLDMGTGTGVLAILAEKLGANSIFAPDIDEWSYNNALENCKLNNCSRVEVALGTDQLLDGKTFDVLIANINKNILLEQFQSYSNAAVSGAKLLISGFFTTDVRELTDAAEKYGFIFEKEYSKDEWALVALIKK